MADSDIKYTLCDNEDSLQSALTTLKTASVLAFDCEGQDLGQDGGKLSLVSLRIIHPPSSSATFLFDAVKIARSALRPVFDLLESNEIQKVVFDGRMDYSCLFHDHGIRLRDVVDLQLADIKSRVMRGEGEEEQIQRLRVSKSVQRNELAANRELYKAVHKLNGLMQCAEEHQLITPKTEITHISWMNRPLQESYLAHAVRDVKVIHQLYDYFSEHDYIYAELKDDSQKYASIWEDFRPKKYDRHRNNGLLPLDIIDRTLSTETGQCKSCMRHLSRGCFSKTKWNSAKDRQCFMCRAVSVRTASYHGRYSWDYE
ncbi:ribonuclease H-like domain-containing protein [Lyophyllum atratum]|nr:ribonuclease H-like domain-containing protein [Lyophyllum atratum]